MRQIFRKYLRGEIPEDEAQKQLAEVTPSQLWLSWLRAFGSHDLGEPIEPDYTIQEVD